MIIIIVKKNDFFKCDKPDSWHLRNVVTPMKQGRHGNGQSQNPDDEERNDGRREGDGGDVHQKVLLVTNDDQEAKQRDASQSVHGTYSWKKIKFL